AVMARLYPFSERTAALLEEGPVAGECHRWLARVANGLRDTLDGPRCFAFLRKCCDGWISHRRIPDREIEAAVRLAYEAPCEGEKKPKAVDWPKFMYEETLTAVKGAPLLFDGTADTGMTADEALALLFKPGELVCACWRCETAVAWPLEQWLPRAGSAQFLCVNPLAGPSGTTVDGRPSVRCQSNIALRRWLVAEFDDPRMDRTMQARVAGYLDRGLPLALAVDSGGKSLHCWFYCEGAEPRELARFFALACAMGADRTRWDTCGWLRMPGGTRYKPDGSQVRQKIVYFKNRGVCERERQQIC
ncbi:MAG: hypothetical protein WCK89_21260, partial [bacterium]